MYVFVCVNVFMCVVFVCILCFCMVCMLECVFVCLYVFHSINSRTRHLQIAVQASTDIISHTICRLEGEGGNDTEAIWKQLSKQIIKCYFFAMTMKIFIYLIRQLAYLAMTVCWLVLHTGWEDHHLVNRSCWRLPRPVIGCAKILWTISQAVTCRVRVLSLWTLINL